MPRLGKFVFLLVPWGGDERAWGWGEGWHLCGLHSVLAFSLGQAVRSLLVVPAPSHLKVGAGRLLRAGQTRGGQLGVPLGVWEAGSRVLQSARGLPEGSTAALRGTEYCCPPGSSG